MKILSLDPGGTTGWAIYDNSVPEGVHRMWCGEIGPQEHHDELFDFMHEQYYGPKEDNPHDMRIPLYVICESFQYRNNLDKAELISCEYIGIVKYFQRQVADCKLYFQTAGQGKITPTSFVKLKHLEKLGLFEKGKKHAMDAYGHLLYYAIHSGNPEMAELRMSFLQGGWRGGE